MSLLLPKYAQRLNDSFVGQFKTKQPPWGSIGYITYARTYARRLDDSCSCPLPCSAARHDREEAWQTVKRCVEGIAKYGAFTREELELIYYYWFNLKCSGGGRHWWQLGTACVDRLGADSLQNCWFVEAKDLRAFEFAMNQLMLGGGVGFSIRAEHIYKLPPVKFGPDIRRVESFDCDFIVPDNREGWCELLKKTLEAFFLTGKRLHYSTNCVRERGKPIKMFGGTASGGEILVEGISLICNLLRRTVGRQLTSIEAMDIFNIIGHIVVAGNVRRSSELSLGDSNDRAFIRAKRWQDGIIPAYRARSNNSIACSRIKELTEDFWQNYNGEGEPIGLINLELLRTVGRLKDGIGYRPDLKIGGVNPCGEIGLEHCESCNISELFLPNLSDAEFFTAAGLMLKVCKTISSIPHDQPETREVVERNRRIGIGVTGFCQALDKHSERLFDAVYRHVEAEDIKYSKLLGINRSVKLTTIKPSGTLSLLPGVTPGCHPAFSKYYIRRIEFSTQDPLVERAKAAGYWVEPRLNIDGSRDLRSAIVEFPCKAAPGTILQAEVSAIQQLEFQKWLQTWWADNAVSCTVQYSEEELPEIRAWLEKNYDDSVKSTSFLLRGLASGFKQMPYEEIEEPEYEEILKRTKPIENIGVGFPLQGLECSSGSCPAR